MRHSSFLLLLGCATKDIDTSDTATLPAGCVEVVTECPYLSWSPSDYDPNTCEEPDAYACWDGQFLGTPQQEICPDHNPDHEGCDGRDAGVEVRGDQACATCTAGFGELYYGHPDYTGDCDSQSECDCVEQPKPPWGFIRAVVCEG